MDNQLSDCHQAPMKLSGGIGDFNNKDQVVTQSYICTECDQLCNIYVAEVNNQPNPTDELLAIPMVNGLDCPACGHPTLILGNGGYITCSLEGCPNPDYAEALHAHMKAMVEDVIGERENDPDNTARWRAYRNELRDEQRQRAAKWLPKEKQ